MSKIRNTDGAIEDLGVLITAAYDCDTEWMKKGSCHNWGSKRPGHPTPWQVAPGRRYNGLSGSELVKYALLICEGCPAQYDCANFAVRATMIAGTWSQPVTQLRWLQTQDDALEIIEQARKEGEPVQTAVGRMFAERPVPVKIAV